MTRTSDAKQAAAYIIQLVQDDMTHDLYRPVDGTVTTLESFMDLHDFVDANEYLELALASDSLMDWELRDAVCAEVDALLAKRPIRL